MTNLSDLPFITPEDITDRAMEAIAGGRGITASLARLMDGVRSRQYGDHLPDILAGKGGPESLRVLWRNSIDPSIGWESYARGAAATGEHRTFAAIEYGKTKAMTLAQAEAMFDWPIYRAAILPDAALIVDAIVVSIDDLDDKLTERIEDYEAEDIAAMLAKKDRLSDVLAVLTR